MFIDTPVVASKTKDQSGQNLFPFSDQNDTKAIPFGTAYTYVNLYQPPPPPPYLHNYTCQTQTWIEGCII